MHLAALMLRQHDFASTAHAVAWMRLTRPGRLTESIDLAQLERQLSQQTNRRRFSVILCAGHAESSGANAPLEETELSPEPTSPMASSSPTPVGTSSPTLPSPARGPVSLGSGARAWQSPLRSFSTSSPCLSVPPLSAAGEDTGE